MLLNNFLHFNSFIMNRLQIFVFIFLCVLAVLSGPFVFLFSRIYVPSGICAAVVDSSASVGRGSPVPFSRHIVGVKKNTPNMSVGCGNYPKYKKEVVHGTSVSVTPVSVVPVKMHGLKAVRSESFRKPFVTSKLPVPISKNLTGYVPIYMRSRPY